MAFMVQVVAPMCTVHIQEALRVSVHGAHTREVVEMVIRTGSGFNGCVFILLELRRDMDICRQKDHKPWSRPSFCGLSGYGPKNMA